MRPAPPHRLSPGPAAAGGGSGLESVAERGQTRVHKWEEKSHEKSHEKRVEGVWVAQEPRCRLSLEREMNEMKILF